MRGRSSIPSINGIFRQQIRLLFWFPACGDGYIESRRHAIIVVGVVVVVVAVVVDIAEVRGTQQVSRATQNNPTETILNL